MLDLKIDAAKRFFFDRVKVQNAADKMRLRALTRQAMFVRQVARRSMRSGGKKGKASEPGQPPRYHAKKLLRDKLFAIYDPSTRSSVIGPSLLNGKARRNHGKTVPETLEFGGQVDAFQGRKRVVAEIEPRPYMGPALKTTNAKFAEQFRGQFGRAA